MLVVLGLLFAVVASKVIDLQVVNPERNLAWGEAQRVGTTTLAAERGSILDRNGAELAVSRPTRSVFVDPQLIQEPAAEAARVAPLLGLDVTEVTAKMAGEGRFAYLKRKVSPEVADQVEALGLPGVAFLDESQRYLPAGESARSLLGTVDPDNNGISGLEAMYGDALTGTPGQLSLETNPAGRTIAVGDHNLVPAVPGSDLTLTIDRAIQFEAERLLVDQVGTTEAKGGIAIVTKPGTGEILAMANVVRDPETGRCDRHEQRRRHHAVRAGLGHEAGHGDRRPRAGRCSRTPLCTCPRPSGSPTPSSARPSPGARSAGASTRSSRTPRTSARSRSARRSDGTPCTRRCAAFGFGRRPHWGSPNESAGALLEPIEVVGHLARHHRHRSGRRGDAAADAEAYNVVANRGDYVAPSLVSATIDADGVEHPTIPSDGRRVWARRPAPRRTSCCAAW